LSLGNFAAPLPSTVSVVTMCFDADEAKPLLAERIKQKAMTSLHEPDRRVVGVRPDDGCDFNDMIRAVG
jgi:hypothetical protein